MANQQISFVYPGDLDTPTGGYRYDRALIGELEKLGGAVSKVSLTGSYPFPSLAEKEAASETFANIPDGAIVVIDGLAGGFLPEALSSLAKRCQLVYLNHHPLCLEQGLTSDEASELKASEAQSLQNAHLIVTTSPATVQDIRALFPDVETRIETVLPGVKKPAPIEAKTRSGKTTPIKLLCVGSIIERKAHDVLISALAELKDLEWSLDCVGETRFQENWFQKVVQQSKGFGLEDLVTFHGPVDQNQLMNFYNEAELFVLPSRHEGYGMVFAEAICHGLPVIACDAGAVGDTVPKEAGILVPPNDVAALSEALRYVISDFSAYEKLARGANNAAFTFPTWEESGHAFLNHIKELRLNP